VGNCLIFCTQLHPIAPKKQKSRNLRGFFIMSAPKNAPNAPKKHPIAPKNADASTQRTHTLYNSVGCRVGGRVQRAEKILRMCRDIISLTDMVMEAAATERKLSGVLRKNYKAQWPDYPDEWSSYGYTDSKVLPGPATASEIDAFDLILPVICEMDDEHRKLIWAVAHSAVQSSRGPQWQKIAKIIGVHRVTVKNRFENAMLTLWYKLKKDAKRT
tara:strand:- start:3644 stop:4288 length:645 start_codon:yes stop_codon:yes gene_type:complete